MFICWAKKNCYGLFLLTVTRDDMAGSKPGRGPLRNPHPNVVVFSKRLQCLYDLSFWDDMGMSPLHDPSHPNIFFQRQSADTHDET